MNDNQPNARVPIISAVTTPLAFLVLGFLIVDGTVATLALTLTDFRQPLVWTVIISIPLFVLTVVGMAIWQPEALRGDRPLDSVFSNQFASDLYLSLDGALGNLELAERAEAWLTVAEVISNSDQTNDAYKRFCVGVSARLTQLANLTNRTVNTRGPIA